MTVEVVVANTHVDGWDHAALLDVGTPKETMCGETITLLHVNEPWVNGVVLPCPRCVELVADVPV